MRLPLPIKRILRRIKYVFLFRSIFWKYESCQDCGHCFRLVWSVSDHIWKKVVDDTGGGTLCIDCFIERAEKKKIALKESHFNVKVFIVD